MECPGCHFENSAQARFCAGCGAHLTVRCPACGQEVASSARFCQQCGSAIAAESSRTGEPVAAGPTTVVAPPVEAPLASAAIPIGSGAGFVAAGPGPAVTMPIGGGAVPLAPANAGFSIERTVLRMIRATRLERGVYEEVQFDPAGMTDAITVVIISGAAVGIGEFLAMPRSGVGLVLIGLVSTLIGWYLGAYLAYYIGVKAFGGRGTANEMLRLNGLAHAPGVAGVLLFIPVLGWLLAIAAAIWDMVVAVVAVRTALDFDTGRAVATMVTSFVLSFLVALLITSVLVSAVLSVR